MSCQPTDFQNIFLHILTCESQTQQVDRQCLQQQASPITWSLLPAHIQHLYDLAVDKPLPLNLIK